MALFFFHKVKDKVHFILKVSIMFKVWIFVIFSKSIVSDYLAKWCWDNESISQEKNINPIFESLLHWNINKNKDKVA